ncbi:hypothetical protein [Spiroplasma endosymbiont of Danaus chrysippus]|nr:hypothetical protein [Spiroplasma endosymbiont of Danaus chrysippus]
MVQYLGLTSVFYDKSIKKNLSTLNCPKCFKEELEQQLKDIT